jgi:hypothetical protein
MCEVASKYVMGQIEAEYTRQERRVVLRPVVDVGALCTNGTGQSASAQWHAYIVKTRTI